MKNIVLSAVMITLGFTLAAQPAQTASKEKMKVFSSWIGHWQGEGWMQMGPGEPRKSTVDETITSKLDGTVLLVEGIGKSLNTTTQQETIIHHALGVLSYDDPSAQYKFKSYLKDGRSTDAWITVTGENKFQWGFDIPGRGKMRYSIILDQKTWKEMGEFSADGASWSKFFEMNLKKVE